SAIGTEPAGRQFALVRPGGTAFAEDLRGDALADFALGVAVFEEQEVGVRVHVDETWSDDEAARVDFTLRRRCRHPSERHDPVMAPAHVAAEPGVAAAAHDLGV